MSNAKFCTAESLHAEISQRISEISGKAYLFFDEIQEVADWEKCINSCRIDFDCDIYITGSNAKLLSGELATHLAGRYVEFVIYPFSFAEFVAMRTQQTHSTDIAKFFREYTSLGGMPFLSNLIDNSDACNQYLKDVYNSVVLKDIVKRNKIRDVDHGLREANYGQNNRDIELTLENVVSMDEFDMSRNGIKHFNIRDFLLMDEWN